MKKIEVTNRGIDYGVGDYTGLIKDSEELITKNIKVEDGMVKVDETSHPQTNLSKDKEEH